MGAVCIGHKSGSTNFLSKATANKVSRRALLDHMFRLRSTASLRCKHCHFVVPSMFCLQNSTVACDQLSRWRRLLRILCVHHGSFVNDPYEVLLGVIKISLFLVCRERRDPFLLPSKEVIRSFSNIAARDIIAFPIEILRGAAPLSFLSVAKNLGAACSRMTRWEMRTT